MRLAAILSALAIISTLLVIVPSAVGSDQSKIVESLEDLSEVVISEVPEDAFANPKSAEGQRAALFNKIAAVIRQVKAGAYEGAVNKLKNDISNAIMNWIVDQEWETDLLEQLNEIIKLLEGVLPPNFPPVAEFSESAETVLTNVAIEFDASSSYDPDGYIMSYFWDFGDEKNASGVTTGHMYEDDGAYIVALTVTDNDGATATVTSTKTVLNRIPVALFTENATTVFTGEVIRFDAFSSYDPDGYIISYLWDFGDGNTAVGIVVNHGYEDDDVYTVTLTVIDDDGATESTGTIKTVSNRSPEALFIENATIVKEGEVIHFDASGSYDVDGNIASYFWDFGDGTNAIDMIVDHAYAENGNFTVTLTVTDDDGATDSTAATKTVKPLEGWPLALLAAIGLGVASLTATILYGLYRRRKKR